MMPSNYPQVSQRSTNADTKYGGPAGRITADLDTPRSTTGLSTPARVPSRSDGPPAAAAAAGAGSGNPIPVKNRQTNPTSAGTSSGVTAKPAAAAALTHDAKSSTNPIESYLTSKGLQIGKARKQCASVAAHKALAAAAPDRVTSSSKPTEPWLPGTSTNSAPPDAVSAPVSMSDGFEAQEEPVSAGLSDAQSLHPSEDGESDTDASSDGLVDEIASLRTALDGIAHVLSDLHAGLVALHRKFDLVVAGTRTA